MPAQTGPLTVSQSVNAGSHLVDGEPVYLITLRLQRDWPRNVLKNGHVDLDVGGPHFTGHVKQIVDATRLARCSVEHCTPSADHRRSRTGTRLSLNRNGQGQTIPVPFSVLRQRTFAERVKKARMQRGLTQKALSVRAGLSKDLVWRWERGRHGGRPRSVERIGDVLGVEAAYYVAGPTT